MASNSKEHDPADVRAAEWLLAKGVAQTPNEAWEKVRHARENPDAAYLSVYNSALRSNGGNDTEAKKVADAFVASVAARHTPPAPPSQPLNNTRGGIGSDAARSPEMGMQVDPIFRPAPQRPDMMTPGDGGKPITSVMPPGSGSRDQPYQATVQEHVDWFRQNAPAGAVIVVNGQAYTK